jgi:hypothetical protein
MDAALALALLVRHDTTNNNKAQSAVNASWTRNRESANQAARKPPDRQMSHAAIPIKAYSTVQTGPNFERARPARTIKLYMERAIADYRTTEKLLRAWEASPSADRTQCAALISLGR